MKAYSFYETDVEEEKKTTTTMTTVSGLIRHFTTTYQDVLQNVISGHIACIQRSAHHS